MAQKRYPEAQALFQRSLEVRSKVLGHFHPELSAVHNAIGNLHECQKDLTGAIAHYNVALQLNRKVPLFAFICFFPVFKCVLSDTSRRRHLETTTRRYPPTTTSWATATAS
jgi:tetratricopeptide (TPR) repeat protein